MEFSDGELENFPFFTVSVLPESVVVIPLNKFFLLCLQGPIPCFIEKVLMTTNADEVTLIKILLRQTRRPELGDNF
jgi:DNA-directed RNA polymerase III subunit RPC2